jgi:alkanesulfonate monooxygenase SsuD/methylene tetrahydromethanopterin reductase-like flavin-dependent oxidoreductase (luciferase family)
VAGEYVRLDRVALDYPPAVVPPLLVGARKPKTLELAGELADGVVLDADLAPEGVRAAVATVAARRPHEVVFYLPCAAGDGARERLGAALNPERGDGPDRVAVGTPDEVAATIRAFADAGATTVVLQPPGDDPELDATLRLAAEAAQIVRSATS